MAESKATAKAEPKVEKRVLGRASESGDPAVHQLLAEIQSAVQNGNVDKETEARKRLADLGYE